jgi:hypothetical protein
LNFFLSGLSVITRHYFSRLNHPAGFPHCGNLNEILARAETTLRGNGVLPFFNFCHGPVAFSAFNGEKPNAPILNGLTVKRQLPRDAGFAASATDDAN